MMGGSVVGMFVSLSGFCISWLCVFGGLVGV